jgi:hypothetical protein
LSLKYLSGRELKPEGVRIWLQREKGSHLHDAIEVLCGFHEAQELWGHVGAIQVLRR